MLSCDNVLQPSSLRGSGCNTLSHSGLANVKTQKIMFYSLNDIWKKTHLDKGLTLCLLYTLFVCSLKVKHGSSTSF